MNEQLWHGLSKTLAEKTAWALAMDRGISMVSINGGLVMGPDVTISNPYLKGAAEMYEDGVMASVDLRFYVDAHICVFEDVSSYGRYLCFNHVINCNEDAMKLARMLLPPSDTSTPPLRLLSYILILDMMTLEIFDVIETLHNRKINYFSMLVIGI